MKKIFRKIHLWLSVPFGLIITLVCFSGAMLVFENEANEWFRRDLYYVETVKGSPLPMDKLLEKVATTLPDSVAVTGVSISSDPGRAYQVSLSKPRRASLYVDQYTGEVKGKSERSGFFMFMFRMHRWLLDSMNPGNEGIFWGKMIVGVSTLLLVFVLISGIVIWWPRTRKALKNSLKITATKGWRRFWYDLHVAGGMYALIFLLAMALTGLTWSFPWYRTAFYKVFGVEVQQRAAQGHEQKSDAQKRNTKLAAHREKKREGNEVRKGERSRRPENNHSDMYSVTSPFVYWQEIYDKLRRQNLDPEYKQISISSGTASVSFNVSVISRHLTVILSIRIMVNLQKQVFINIKTSRERFVVGFILCMLVTGEECLLRILTFIAALLGVCTTTDWILFMDKKTHKGTK